MLFPVPTRCASRLLFMNACKAPSAEANGMGTLPCFSVNNAFGTILQSFKGIGGLLQEVVEHSVVLESCEDWPVAQRLAL